MLKPHFLNKDIEYFIHRYGDKLKEKFINFDSFFGINSKRTWNDSASTEFAYIYNIRENKVQSGINHDTFSESYAGNFLTTLIKSNLDKFPYLKKSDKFIISKEKHLEFCKFLYDKLDSILKYDFEYMYTNTFFKFFCHKNKIYNPYSLDLCYIMLHIEMERIYSVASLRRPV